MAAPSPVPVRYPSGVTNVYPFSPLANFGLPFQGNYHNWYDDFDIINAGYTQTNTGNGTIAVTPGNGGLALFTTNSSTPAGTDVSAIQLPAAGFPLTLGKKAFFGCRLQLSSATNAAFRVGLEQTTATPFTTTDGITFQKATGSLTNLSLVSTVTSVNTTMAIPTASYTLANATNIDMAFYVDRNGVIYGFAGPQLFGWIPQSGTSTLTPGSRGASVSMQPTLTAVNLNFTVAIQSGTAASSTMTVDFAYAAIER